MECQVVRPYNIVCVNIHLAMAINLTSPRRRLPFAASFGLLAATTPPLSWRSGNSSAVYQTQEWLGAVGNPSSGHRRGLGSNDTRGQSIVFLSSRGDRLHDPRGASSRSRSRTSMKRYSLPASISRELITNAEHPYSGTARLHRRCWLVADMQQLAPGM